ncbi:hypothetical protein GTP45_04815 [Pseudoduganella sp. FT55W]|uniref:BrnA antitoxin of type II toxin-antitoxin system n=1 Tax=Duganella rivi TaxID=2666083 RepID=A0A7X4KBC8_9BURK|nr:hypothetical protein [Duganella rivi]MYM66158.1 hypothetical protein [Duganella rivi]
MRFEWDSRKAKANLRVHGVSFITFRLDFDSISYFEQLGQQYGLSAEEMMYMYLRHIAGSGYKANLGILTLKEREELKKSLEAEGDLPLEG